MHAFLGFRDGDWKDFMHIMTLQQVEVREAVIDFFTEDCREDLMLADHVLKAHPAFKVHFGRLGKVMPK